MTYHDVRVETGSSFDIFELSLKKFINTNLLKNFEFIAKI